MDMAFNGGGAPMNGANRERPYRMRQKGRESSETDVVTFALAVQTVMVLILLLCVVAVKTTDEGKYFRFKEQYAVMLSASSEIKGEAWTAAKDRVIHGITGFFKGHIGRVFGWEQQGGYEPSDIEEPPDDAEFWSEPQAPESPEPAQAKKTAAFLLKLHDAQWYAGEEKPGPQQNGTLYLRPPAPGGGLFPVEIMERGGVMKAPYAAAFSPPYWPIIPPVPGVITSGFSYREHPISGKEDFHTGIDIAANEGDDILAAMSGVVKRVGESEIYGKYVILKHSETLETSYSHCSEILIKEGMYVRQGERIARVGETGITTGPHLHFSVIADGDYKDPAWFLRDYIEILS